MDIKKFPLAIYLLQTLFFVVIIFTKLHAAGLIFVCGEDNDLLNVCQQNDIDVTQFDDVTTALKKSETNQGVLMLADGYPAHRMTINQQMIDVAVKKRLRMYIEFPNYLPGLDIKAPKRAAFERGVVVSDFFGDFLKEMRIVTINDCHYLSIQAEYPLLVLAKVAGFDTAIFGLQGTTPKPLLFKHPTESLLIATTKLSGFVSGRYAPEDAWRHIWLAILRWLQPNSRFAKLNWAPSVHPCYQADEHHPKTFERDALLKGIEWFFNARMLIDSSWQHVYDNAREYPDRVGQEPQQSWPSGNGSLGVLEGYSSNIRFDGKQNVRWWRRNDCNGEVAGAMALSAQVFDQSKYKTVSRNIADFVMTKSILSQGERIDPTHPAFGLIGWNDVEHYWRDLDGYGVYYGDDNARGLLGIVAAAAILKTDKWDERVVQCLLANLRTTGPLGFRNNRIDEADLKKNGWRHFFDTPTISYAPHYQAYMWACFLWAYHQTGYSLFLERAKSAIRKTMDVYPDEWRWTNGMQQERARMLLPLAWLVRVENNQENRTWLRKMAEELLRFQDSCGAIREELGERGHGSYHPPESNQAYGTTEAPLIQENGDAVCDLLYTSNFAFLGLHEAAAATGNSYFQEAEDRLAQFLCRIQVASDSHPEFDGAWFRAFDFKRWEYWASNADAGWGAWSIETGWTQAWITAVLAMRQLNQNLWDLTGRSRISKYLEKNRKIMIPE